MVIVVNDSALGDVRELSDFELDLAFGSDENALSLECDAAYAPEEGQFVFIDGTEYGGVIDQASYEAGREAMGSILCKGRTWHGILAGKRLLPDSGSGYLSVSGKAGEVLASLIERMGLSELFSAASDDTSVSYTFDRFVDGYSGLKAMAKANGRKVAMRRKGGKVEISLPPVVDYANKVDSDLLDFTLTSVHRCVNHLVCAGAGELENRAVVHFYADETGNVSHTQTFFGVDEICALYDYSNADADKLEEEGKKKLKEYQTKGSVEVDAHDDIDVDVGDVISARDNAHGRTVSATVVKKIVQVSRGVATYKYEVGSETSTKTSSSGSAEGSGGGGLMSAADKAALDGIANVRDWVVSRGENLVSNGYATLGDNTNFSGAAFDGADAFQSGGSFSHRATSPSTLFTDEPMPYDPSIAYRLSYYIKGDCADARYYDILDCFDIDGLRIDDSKVTFTPGSTTRLAADLKPGDTHVSLESVAGFNASDSDGRQRFNRGLMFWDYANSYGYEYPPETYTRNRHDGLWSSNASAIDKSSNRVALDKPWSGRAVPKGTGVSQTENGATFVYGNAYFTVPAGEWTRKEVTLEGKARPGTAYVKIGWLIPNVMGGASSVTTKLTGVSFGAVPAYSKTASFATDSNNSKTADRLKTARKVAISGAVNGSATWDGSGDLSIVVAGDTAAAGFLAAHPVGTFIETNGYDPSDYGGEWSMAPSIGPYTWLRTK